MNYWVVHIIIGKRKRLREITQLNIKCVNWMKWMRLIFSSGTSSVLLNSIPGKTIHCRRGVRQGDPLSPLLFVLAADLLQSLILRKEFGTSQPAHPLAAYTGLPYYPICR